MNTEEKLKRQSQRDLFSLVSREKKTLMNFKQDLVISSNKKTVNFLKTVSFLKTDTSERNLFLYRRNPNHFNMPLPLF